MGQNGMKGELRFKCTMAHTEPMLPIPQGLLQRSICLRRCSHTGSMAHRLQHSRRSRRRTGTLPRSKRPCNRRLLPGCCRKRGKVTYKRSSCCWQGKTWLEGSDINKIKIIWLITKRELHFPKSTKIFAAMHVTVHDIIKLLMSTVFSQVTLCNRRTWIMTN